MEKSISERVKEIVVDKLNVQPTEVVASASFMGDLGADSLDRVELVLQLETEFKVAIADEQAEKFLTVGDVIEFLEKNVDKTQA